MVSKLIRSMMRNLNREIIDDLKLARNVKHPGEGGRARENAIVEFLEKLVPKNFQVSTGFVIDALGNISPQIDIVISRRGYHPVFEVGGVKHFMIESVHAVVENKSRITDRATLTDALGKIKSVKKMDRTNRGRNYTMIGTERGPEVDSAEFRNQVFGAIVTEKSLSLDVFHREMAKFRNGHRREYWPNVYADVNHFSALYIHGNPKTKYWATPNPIEADYFFVTDRAKKNFVPPLIELGMLIVNFLRTAPLIDYNATDYILSASGDGNVSKL